MKVHFGFNAIRQDGMGSAALTLLRALIDSGVAVQPVHPWKQVEAPEYFQFNPIFLSESSEQPPLSDSICDMIEAINSDPACKLFSHFSSPNWGAIVPYLRPDIRLVVSVHSITPSSMKIALANHERVSKYVAISQKVEDILRKKLPRKDHGKIMRVSNAIDVSRFEEKSYFAKRGERIRIVYLGRVEDYTKGADKIPRIAHKLKQAGLDFEWHLYGYFHWGYEDRFFDQLRKHDVEDVVRYQNCLNPKDVPSVLSEYDIMVMPSNHEGWPLSLGESMAAGLTCVASRLPGVTDHIVDHGRDGFLVGRNDIKGFADAVLAASADPDSRKVIGAAAREKIVTKFSSQQHGLKYREVFEGALADRPTVDFKQLPMPSGGSFKMPTSLKPVLLARILPGWLKRELKKII